MFKHSWKNVCVCLLLATALFGADASAMGKKKPDPNANVPNDRSWVAVNLFDSIYPLTSEETFPEALSSIETIMQLFTKRKAIRDLKRTLHLPVSKKGDRSNMGHFLIWIHLSDDFVKNHPEIDREVEPYMFMFPDRKTDIFTAWSGAFNMGAFLTHGIIGFSVPRINSDGTKAGNFQSFKDIVPLGDADYEGGWYMNDEQAARILTSFHSYQGPDKGYSFLRPVSETTNPGHEPKGARLANGYNCGDFVFYALVNSGLMTRETAESLKIDFWYPKTYFDRPLPLAGVGQKGYDWLMAHPGQTYIPDSETIKMAWFPLLFSPKGIEFFNKKQIVDEFNQFEYPLERAKIWDQAHVIEWMKAHADFNAKGIMSELYPIWKKGWRIVAPERTVAKTPRNHWLYSWEHDLLEEQGQRFEERKLKAAGLWDWAGEQFHILYEKLKLQAESLN